MLYRKEHRNSQCRREMLQTSLYCQFEIQPVRVLFFFLSKHIHFLISFQIKAQGYYLFTYFSETLEGSFKESQLVQSLHKLLRDDDTSAEVKYNSMGLLCRLLNSGNFILSSVMEGWIFVVKTMFSDTKMSCLQCSSEWVKDTRGSFCIDH